MTAERLELLLLGVRNAASELVTSLLVEEIQGGPERAGVAIDARQVWHASEIALAMIHPGYVPKREAVEELLERVSRFTGS